MRILSQEDYNRSLAGTLTGGCRQVALAEILPILVKFFGKAWSNAWVDNFDYWYSQRELYDFSSDVKRVLRMPVLYCSKLFA